MDFAKELRVGVFLTVLFVLVVSFLFITQPATQPPTGIVPLPTQPTTSRPILRVGDDDNEENIVPLPTRTVTSTQANPTQTPTLKTSFTVSEVAKHSNQNDCWIIIGGSVYSVTNYLFVHPGGAGQIIPYCGADATMAYQSIGKHGSSRAQADLSSVFIGLLK